MSEKRAHPVGGVDYPRTLQEFDEWFASEGACRDYLQRLRWPDGFRCPACGEGRAWMTGRGQFRCGACQRQTSPIAGTIFEGTRKPLRAWFQAMWYVTSQKHGGSALGLQRVLGLGSYQTAWTWLHKVRRAMVRPGRDRLSGCVEVDETYVGGIEEGVHGRETESKAVVVVAAEEDGRGIGRVRLRRVPNVSAASLLRFVEEAVAPGSVVHTDGWGGYNDLEVKGYGHRVTNITRSEQLAHELLPRVHRVASLLKRWLLGTHHGAVRGKHLGYYLDEFTFRFNRRRARARGLLFYRLLQQAVDVGPAPYSRLVAGKGGPHHKI
ncbi:MAG: IS1595 family transposase [Acidobacteria bacterium]|nr:IS1595 family transposase [Acidobacteriota bacterium]